MHRKDVAVRFYEISTLLDLSGADSFRIRSYQNVARMLESTDVDLEALTAEERLTELKGVGKAMAEKIATLVTTGALPYLEDLRDRVPSGLVEMLRLPDLGPKKVKQIHVELGIEALDTLERAARDGNLRRLSGFGAKTEENLLKGLERLRERAGRYRLDKADRWVVLVLDALATTGNTLASAVGGVRRRRETVKSVDILVGAHDATAGSASLSEMDDVAEIRVRDDTTASVVMSDGITINLHVVSPNRYPLTLLHLTGSEAHTTALGSRARERGFTLDDQELSDGKSAIECESEADVYSRLGLSEIPPELREGLGEIEDHEGGRSTPLITLSDLQGILHFHTTRSDGKNTLAEMVDAARDVGATYVGLADHSQAATYANGLTPDRVLEQFAEADELNRLRNDIRVLKGIEVDILSDGALDYDDALLARFDFVIASVHSAMKLPEAKMMERIERAFRHPAVNIFGHPTGRLLLKRDAYAVDMDRVARMAVDHGVALEINAHPQRLDTDWRVIRRSRELGVRYVICPDAHGVRDYDYLRYGVDVARKGGLDKSDVLNTHDADRFLERLRALKNRAS